MKHYLIKINAIITIKLAQQKKILLQDFKIKICLVNLDLEDFMEEEGKIKLI